MQNVFRRLSLPLFLLVLLSVFSLQANAATGHNRMEKIAGSMLKHIGQATYVKEGKGPHIIYIFFDPNCPYCHRLYEHTRKWIKQGKVQLRWIPVGILTTTSPGKAAAILGAKDPLKAFYYNENHYKNGGGIEEDLPSASTDKKLKANAALLARSRVGAVPAMLFRTKDNKPYLIEGAPPTDKLPIILANVK
ncbi:MAG: thiol:disulfide interchange protein DsbG [Gammaproteobacteria bacterium]|jgi:thiol:disulfide interchange protein DsbG